MTILHDETSSGKKTVDGRQGKCDPRRAAAWLLLAVGLLAAGLVAGTLLYAWQRDLGWIAPLVCFAGYILAFRRAMLVWDCDIDRSWRSYLRLEGRRSPGSGSDPYGGARRPLKAVR